MVGIILRPNIEAEFRARNYYPGVPIVDEPITDEPLIPDMPPEPEPPPDIPDLPHVPAEPELPEVWEEEPPYKMFYALVALSFLIVKDRWLVDSYY